MSAPAAGGLQSRARALGGLSPGARQTIQARSGASSRQAMERDVIRKLSGGPLFLFYFSLRLESSLRVNYR